MQLLLYVCSTRKCVLYSEPEFLRICPQSLCSLMCRKTRRKKKSRAMNAKLHHFLPQRHCLCLEENWFCISFEKRWGSQASCFEVYAHEHCSGTDTVHGCHRTNSMLPKWVDPSLLSALSCLLLPFPSSVLRLAWLLRVLAQLSNAELFQLAEFALTLVRRPGSPSGI